MIILSIFVVLNLIVFGYLWFQWDKISIAVDAVGMASHFIGNNINNENIVSKHNKLKMKVLMFLAKFRKFLWIPIGIIAFINLIVASIIGGIVSLILMLF